MATKKSSKKKPAAKKAAPKPTSKKKPAPKIARKSVVAELGHPIVGKDRMNNPGECPTCTMDVSINLSGFDKATRTWANAKVTWDPDNKVLTVTDQS